MAKKISKPKKSSGPKKLLDLEKGDCRWPIGEPRHPDFHFCGAPQIVDRRVERLRRAGRDTGASEDLLRLLLQTRKLMLVHQKTLEREMAEWRTLHPEH